MQRLLLELFDRMIFFLLFAKPFTSCIECRQHGWMIILKCFINIVDLVFLLIKGKQLLYLDMPTNVKSGILGARKISFESASSHKHLYKTIFFYSLLGPSY
jgi:hypothetical protein